MKKFALYTVAAAALALPTASAQAATTCSTWQQLFGGCTTTGSTGGTTATTGTVYEYQTVMYPASAGYNGVPGTAVPVTLKIDTKTGTATYTGNGVNITMQGNSLKNFKGGATPPSGTYTVSSISGTMTFNGKTYTPYASTYPKTTSIVFTGSSATPYLWTYAKDSSGKVYDLDLKTSINGYTSYPSSSGSTTTGGTTTGGTTTGGTTTGGTTGGTTTGGTTTGGTTTGGTTTGGTTTGGTTTGGTTSGGTTTGGTTTGGTTTGGTTTGGTTTGGTTSGGGSTGGGSTGGTDVPAPGVLGLMALAALGVGASRRRKK